MKSYDEAARLFAVRADEIPENVTEDKWTKEACDKQGKYGDTILEVTAHQATSVIISGLLQTYGSMLPFHMLMCSILAHGVAIGMEMEKQEDAIAA